MGSASIHRVILIGMAGAGKSTVGVLLARELAWAFLDTDLVIQQAQGEALQSTVDRLGQAAFRQLEEATICGLNPPQAVIATGGSVVYYPRAMAHLQALGTVVWLDVPLPLIEARIAQFPDRGLAIQPGQTIADLFHERAALYAAYAHWRIDCQARDTASIVQEIRQRVAVRDAR